ncbi:MAG: glycoside hydrolase family 57, partial [Zetaproteobacteria bacterium]
MSELSVAILWHMHQPFYRPVGGSFRLPWVYLHAIREYHDMAAWLEEVPEATVNVNFTPSLVVQLEEYDRNLRAFFSRQAETTGDRLLDVLAHGAASVPPQDRRWVIAQALRAHETHMIARFPAFARLAATARQVLADGEAHWVSDAFVDDLIVWYHLAWMGETVRSTDLVCQRLLAKEKDYTAEDRRALLARIHALIAEVLPRWKRLAARGQVELSTTPYAHPILPLLLDFTAAHATEPEAEIPDEPYPRGKERARWHIEAAMRTHSRVFGEPPRGVWPAEGGVSEEALALFAASGFQWAATGEAVLNHSLGAAARAAAGASPLYAPWRVDTPEGPMGLVFRDDRLSDKIGFEYQ